MVGFFVGLIVGGMFGFFIAVLIITGSDKK